MQNDYDELFNLLDWAVPGGLGDRRQFQLYYEEPIKMAQKKDVNETALGKVCYGCCAFLQQWKLARVSQLHVKFWVLCYEYLILYFQELVQHAPGAWGGIAAQGSF